MIFRFGCELLLVCSWNVDRINLGSVSQILFVFPVYTLVRNIMILGDVFAWARGFCCLG